MVYHIAQRDDWNRAKVIGVYKISSLDREGFIHFSKKEQVVDVANLLYKGQTDLILLCVDESLTQAEMKFEDLKGHGEFPHLYGPLNLNGVKKVIEFPCKADGTFELPSEIV